MNICHACKKEIPDVSKSGRRDVCGGCGADLRCCLNCAHYDRSASKQCREPVAELIKNKEKANFCDYFRFAEHRTAQPGNSSDSARKALDDLFKK